MVVKSHFSAFLLVYVRIFTYLCGINLNRHQYGRNHQEARSAYPDIPRGDSMFHILSVFYPYHFYYQEQNQLFLGTWDYVLHYLDKQPFVNTQDTIRDHDDYRAIMHELAKSTSHSSCHRKPLRYTTTT